MLTLMLITKHPSVARHVHACGVQRIFVDMEILGKHERQGHLNTVISDHTLNDVASIRTAVPKAELMVRLNPLHTGSDREVDGAIEAGADFLMLPMFRSAEELARFSKIVNGRVGIIPLVETREAAGDIRRVVRVPGLYEVFLGLNDLHLSLGLKFMFELLANGTVDRISDVVQQAGLRFGFGGIARMGEGTLPGDLVLGEHVRLGSQSVILSRAFHKGLGEVELARSQRDDFWASVSAVRAFEHSLARRTPEQTLQDQFRLQSIVAEIVASRSQQEAA